MKRLLIIITSCVLFFNLSLFATKVEVKPAILHLSTAEELLTATMEIRRAGLSDLTNNPSIYFKYFELLERLTKEKVPEDRFKASTKSQNTSENSIFKQARDELKAQIQDFQAVYIDFANKMGVNGLSYPLLEEDDFIKSLMFLDQLDSEQITKLYFIFSLFLFIPPDLAFDETKAFLYNLSAVSETGLFTLSINFALAELRSKLK
ncbi:MAG: hypothetical protein ABIA04_13055 [Pseudomonadota bacterium]